MTHNVDALQYAPFGRLQARHTIGVVL